MMRLVIAFFVLLSSSAIGGSNDLFPGALSFHSCTKFTFTPQQSILQATNQQTIENANTAGAEDDALNATEIEDDDFDFSRKHIESSDYFINFSHAQVSGNAHRYLKDRLPICKHFSCISTDRHILYRVIRI